MIILLSIDLERYIFVCIRNYDHIVEYRFGVAMFLSLNYT
jgi:hypothetical protein